MAYQNILFDLDGTLTDSKEGITKAVQYALSKFDIDAPNLDLLESFIGPPLEVSFKDLYHFSEEDIKKAISHYRVYFAEQGMYENVLYPGIENLLKILKGKGRRIYVATSKPTFFAEQILKHFSIDSYFDGVFGSHLDGRRVDKTEIIAAIMKERIPTDETVVMIGDRKYDIIGARNNGVDTIAVGYGYGSEDELKICEPNYFVHNLDELLIFLG
ncbi:MAG: HAD family hydrolase [Vallitaleaceae bacterium]|nr:HAD family hydrolase [Vallitaleaceae bacterium]